MASGEGGFQKVVFFPFLLFLFFFLMRYVHSALFEAMAFFFLFFPAGFSQKVMVMFSNPEPRFSYRDRDAGGLLSTVVVPSCVCLSVVVGLFCFYSIRGPVARCDNSISNSNSNSLLI